MTAPGDAQTYQEGPTGHKNKCVDDANAPCRDTRSGGCRGKLEASGGVEVDWDRQKVVKDAGYDGRHPKSIRDAHNVETSVLRQVRGPRGHSDEEVKSGDIGDEWKRQSDGDGVKMDETGCRMDGATSGARRNSKQVETQPLAGVETGQHQQRNRMTAHVPQPSTPPPRYARSLSNYMNPPRRRGRIKTRSRQVSRAQARKLTHQFERSHRGCIGRPRSDGYTPYTWLKTPTKVTHLR